MLNKKILIHSNLLLVGITLLVSSVFAGRWDTEFDGVETLCGERWGIWDIKEWAESNPVHLDKLSHI